ncbi:DNA primase [Cohnella xylanilytica]|uniref:DNA primase n=1 Tax=Cohnella xylanilytica TaxID=557555 RepID=A0A841U4G2_9BACL|nr:DNA primase [Cohnella xylanilytica]MBB6695455.1 DNA primase [Cohnella xylanilytica]GIO13362.1 DNA primase [Cohnella xylanilytica]
MNNGMIPQSAIDEVLRRYDIAETVGRYVHLTKQGKYLKGLCPFHSEKTPSFTVTPEKQIYHCYGCGKGGNVIKFVMEMENETFPEAVKRLAEEAGIAVTWSTVKEGEELSPRQKERETLVEAHGYATKLYHYVLRNTAAGKPAMDYLRSRGFSDKLIEEFGIGYAPSRWDTLTQALQRNGFELPEMERGGLLSRRQEGEGYVDRFRDRIMFPIHGGDGRVIAFAGRLMSAGQPKYLNSPETPLFAKSRTLYRLPEARGAIRKTRQVVLFEGYVDVIKAWSAGVTNGVATMGTALTAEHAALLRRFADEAILCYDGDDAGQAAAAKSLPLLENAGFRVRVGLLPPGMDPDEYIGAHGPESFLREVIEGAVSAVKFQLIYLRKSHILLEEDGKIRYLRDAVQLIARRDSPTEREMLLKELSLEFEVSLDTLKQEAADVRRREKLGTSGDIPDGTWNNVWNDNRSSSKHPPLGPAFVQAERQLISWMMQDAQTAILVQNRLGDRFLVEDHAALAAYLYGYYSQGNDPDVGRFIAFLQDDRLERAASAIALEDTPFDERVLEDCLRTIGQAALTRDIESKKDEMLRAERAGDIMRAVQIGTEIIALEKQRKEG